MTEVSVSNQDKKLSQLREIAKDIVMGIQSVIMTRDIINQRLEEGRRLGFSDIEIGDAIRKESKGKIPDRTIRYYLPETAKHPEKSRAQFAATLPQNQPNRPLVVPEEPKIPPPPEVHQEAEIVREPPKPINEPLPIPPTKTIEVVFDPAPIDRDRTQVFIIEIDIVTKKVKKYKTVGRRSIR